MNDQIGWWNGEENSKGFFCLDHEPNNSQPVFDPAEILNNMKCINCLSFLIPEIGVKTMQPREMVDVLGEKVLRVYWKNHKMNRWEEGRVTGATERAVRFASGDYVQSIGELRIVVRRG